MKTVFMIRRDDGMYLTEGHALCYIDGAAIFLTREQAEYSSRHLIAYDIIEFKLVEVKPTIKITLTSEGTDAVWIKVFLNFDLKNLLSKNTLDAYLFSDIEKAQRDSNDCRIDRSGELAKLRTILQFALPRIETHDIVLGGVLLGHIEYEVIK